MPDKLPADQLWQEWVKKADENELNIKSILKHRDGTSNWVGFLAQQMAEKYLKALLVFHKRGYPKIHDLLRIASLIAPLAENVLAFDEELRRLTRLYIIDRYPGEMAELSWKEAEDAYAAARRIKEFVLSEIAKNPAGG